MTFQLHSVFAPPEELVHEGRERIEKVMIVQATYLIGQRSRVDHVIRLAVLKCLICRSEVLTFLSAVIHEGKLSFCAVSRLVLRADHE